MPDETTKTRSAGFSWGRALGSAFPFSRGEVATEEEPTDAVSILPPPAQLEPDSGATPPAPPVESGLNLDDALMALSRRKPRAMHPRASSDQGEAAVPPSPPAAAPEAALPVAAAPPASPPPGAGEDQDESEADEARWPDEDDRLAAVRRLIPRPEPEAALPPPVSEGTLPEPAPEPRRTSLRRVAATVHDERPARRFRPTEPATLEQAGLDEGLIEGLVVKHLYNNPGASGRALAYEIGLRPTIITRFLEELKMRRLAIHRSAAAMGDFYYELTEEGRALARDLQKDSRYAGPAPVPLDQYIVSVKAQAISTEHPRMPQLRGAFADLLVTQELLDCIGPAVTHGKGMFMYGPPGNGKTSLAERITRAYGSTIYIPHAIWAGGQIIQVYDPAVHVPVDESEVHPGARSVKLDRRWVRCRRPTVIVGGELTLEALDIVYDEIDGVCEAPIQVKANGGTLVIDDFGRQRCRPDELLNRWIVPLEKQVDYIALPGGRKEAFPFECFLIFSTNMEPRELVDEAFLRRIPYKIEVTGPSEELFRRLIDIQCAELGLEVMDGAIDYLIAEHFVRHGRQMRFCHPRDLMLQIYNYCRFREEPGVVNQDTVDRAVLLYFSLL